jgi:hypothetical protein
MAVRITATTLAVKMSTFETHCRHSIAIDIAHAHKEVLI